DVSGGNDGPYPTTSLRLASPTGGGERLTAPQRRDPTPRDGDRVSAPDRTRPPLPVARTDPLASGPGQRRAARGRQRTDRRRRRSRRRSGNAPRQRRGADVSPSRSA